MTIVKTALTICACAQAYTIVKPGCIDDPSLKMLAANKILHPIICHLNKIFLGAVYRSRNYETTQVCLFVLFVYPLWWPPITRKVSREKG